MANERYEADEALAAVRQGRAGLLQAAECPPSRHLAFAAVMGGYVAAPALPLGPRLAALALVLVAVALIVRWDKRRTGVFVNGYRAGRTRWVTLAMLALVLPMYGVGSFLRDERGLWWVPLAMALPAAVVAYAGSNWWMRVFRGEMLGAA